MEPGIREGIHLKAMKTASQHRVLWELVRELAKPIPVYQQSWLTGEVPAAWKLANIMPICKKAQKDDPGNYRLTLVLGNIIEDNILSATVGHMQDKQGIRLSQHGFMRSGSCLTDLISFLW